MPSTSSPVSSGQSVSVKKYSEMTEDEAKAGDKSIQDLTDKYIKEIDKIAAEKDKDIMEI